MKKLFVFVLVSLLLASSVFAGGAAEAKKEEPRTLVISTWGLSADEQWDVVYAPFEEKYNCTVVLDEGNAAERYTKLLNDPNSTVDIIELSQKNIADGVAAGLFQSVSKEDLPVYSEMMTAAQQMVDAGSGLPYTMNAMGIFYNPETIGFEITSWKDLWDERLAGKIAVPAITTTFGPAFVTMCSDVFGGDLATDNGDVAFSALEKLNSNVGYVYTKSSDVANLLKNGEIQVAVVGDFAYNAVSKAEPNGILTFPVEGAYVNFNAINIAKNSKNRDLALEYMNFRASKETEERMARTANETPANTTVELTAEDKANLVIGSEAVANARGVDFNVVNPLYSTWVDRFNRILNR